MRRFEQIKSHNLKIAPFSKSKILRLFSFTLDQKVNSGVTPSEYIYHCHCLLLGGIFLQLVIANEPVCEF